MICEIIEVNKSTKIAVAETNKSLKELKILTNNQFDNEILSFKSETRKKEWLLVRIMLKEIFKENSSILYSEFGKPHLENSSKKISISHSKNYVALMLSEISEVSLDIEVPSDKLLKLAPKFLNNEELKDAESNLQKTCIYWSAKETLYKIYEKKGLVFIDNLFVEPYNIDTLEQINARIKTSEINQKYILNVIQNTNYVLVYFVENCPI